VYQSFVFLQKCLFLKIIENKYVTINTAQRRYSTSKSCMYIYYICFHINVIRYLYSLVELILRFTLVYGLWCGFSYIERYACLSFSSTKQPFY